MAANTSLSKASKVIMGQSPPGDTYNQDGVGLPLLNGPTEFGPTYPECSLFTTDSRRECEPGDLIFCVRGSTTGRMNWADRKYSLGRGVCAFRAPSMSETRFVRYCIQDKLHALLQLAGGGTFPNLTKDTIESFEIPWPDQRVRIAGILSAYDELIENSQRRIKILESMARALYREWFVHFRFPGHESVPRVPSPLGEIPQEWEHATFAQAAVFENGDRGKNYPNGSDFVVEGIPFINAGHLVDGAVNLADMNYILEEKFGQLRSGKIRRGDLLFCLRGSPGRTARTSGIRLGAIASSLVIVRPTERANEAFLFYTLVGEIGKQMATELNNGAAQPNVSVGSVQKYPLLLPPMNLLSNFEKLIVPIWMQMELRREQLSNLRKQRDLLLPRLLSGQIDVEAIAHA